MIAYAALWLFVFGLPWERVITLPGINIMSRIFGVLALVLAVFAVVLSGRLRRWQSLHFAALLFVVIAAFELLVFHSGQRLPSKFWTYVQLLSVLWIIWELAPTWSRVIWLFTAYVFGAYVAALGTIMVYRRAAGSGPNRYSVGGDANDLAMGLALALPIAWYLGMAHRKTWLRWVCRAYLPLGVIAIGLTGSRGGMIVTVLALSFVPLSMTRLTPGRLTMAMATLALAGVLAVAYIPDAIVERLATTTTEIQDLHVGGRFKLWVAGFRAFALKPVLGYGTSGFKEAVYPYLGDATQVAHNSFISVLVEQGIVGLLLYVTMFFGVYLSLLRLPRLERRFALVVFATLVLSMMPLSMEESKRVWFLLAALVGLAKASIPGAQALPIAQWSVRRSAQTRGRGAGAPIGAREPGPLAAPMRAVDRDAPA